jgi:Ca-activated chloride channel family protein
MHAMKKRILSPSGIIVLLLLIGVTFIGINTMLGSRVSQSFSNVSYGLGPGSVPPMLPAPAPSLPAAEEHNAPPPEQAPTPQAQHATVNPFVQTAEDRLSTFAMDVDTASYTAARNYLQSGQQPPPETVRVEEFVNYFHYDYPDPAEATFGIHIDAAPSPLHTDGTHVVRVGIQGRHIERSERDDAVLTFVIDISGSMEQPNRLPLVKESLHMLVHELRDTDQVGIVVYSSNTRVVLEHTPVAQRDTILRAINSLQTEGSTNVEDGLHLGYDLASRHSGNDIINRVILCSDGVANVGATGPDAILKRVRGYTEESIYLTTVGFGMGDFNDYLMEHLANDGNGSYGYVDTTEAARRLFVEELTSTLQVIAKDAKIQVEFNPAVVERYRLLGYENRDVADEDFRNDTVDAGEVGAGHTVTALYEVVMVPESSGAALVAQVRYHDIESGQVIEQQQAFERSASVSSFEEATPHFQLAVVAAGFAEQLRHSGYAGQHSLADVLRVAQRVEQQLDNDEDVQELTYLVQQARHQ